MNWRERISLCCLVLLCAIMPLIGSPPQANDTKQGVAQPTGSNPGAPRASWFDNFDTDPNGTVLFGIRNWDGWAGSLSAAGIVSDALSFSPPHSLIADSVGVGGQVDAVATWSDKTAGVWTMTCMQYIPAATTGQQYFIMLNTYGGATNNWSLQLLFDNVTGMASLYAGGIQTPVRAAVRRSLRRLL